ncbi:MAG TPA: O-antigen ligase family protein [Gammaproteobacteria bacterium]|nr:O-antigen ligase family protein [Gammaproteobacteria bacterium]
MLILVALIPLQNIYLGKIPALGAGLNFVNLMVIAAFILWKSNQERSIPSSTTLHYPVYLFMGIYVVSALNGIYSLEELPKGYFSSLKDVLLPMLIFFIVLNSVRDRRGIVAVVIATLLPLAYMFRVFYAQFSSVYSWHYSDNMRFVNGTFMRLGSNELAAFYAAYTFLVILLVLYIKPLRYRIPLGVLALLNLYSLMYSQSRGAWLAFLAAVFVVLYKTGKFRVLLVAMILSVSAPMIVSMFPVSVQERFESIFAEEEERDSSANSRFIIWENALEQYRHSPLLGVGYRVFSKLNQYQNKDAHNYYLKLLVEQGPAGLLLFILILWRSYKSSNELWQKATEPVFKALGLGVLATVVALAVANMFGDRFSHYPLITYFWVYLALVLRALAILEREQQETPAASVQARSQDVWRMFRPG